MQDGYDISCGIAIETAFIQKNRVENTILAKLLQDTELALHGPRTISFHFNFPFLVYFQFKNKQCERNY
jgi:hypothetical protein